MKWTRAAATGAAALGAVTAYDLTRAQHTVLRNDPDEGLAGTDPFPGSTGGR